MKRLGSILLLLLILLQSGGIFWAYKSGHYALKLDRKERLEDANANFVHLFIPAKAFTLALLDDGQEIEWKGVLYDIKSFQNFQSMVDVIALPDSDEANLLAQFENFLQQTNDHQNQLPITLNLLFVLHYLSPHTAFSLDFNASNPTLVHPKPFAMSTFSASLNSPPPEQHFTLYF